MGGLGVPSPKRVTRLALRESTTPKQSIGGAGGVPGSGRGGALTPAGRTAAPSPSNAAVGVINSLAGLRDTHRALLSRLITGAKATEEEFLVHHNARAAAATGAGGGAGPSGGGPPTSTRGGRSAQKAAAAEAARGPPSCTAFDFLNSSRGGGGGGGGGMFFDVLMTPSMPPDELSMMLEVLNGFDTPGKGF